ncbi:MAG: hypothetical protein ABIJ09_00475 [Pseudomonadota bacterium]
MAIARGSGRGAPRIEGEPYRVRQGDTWSSIAMKHYGDAMLGRVLAEANRAAPGAKPASGVEIVLPSPDVLNRGISAQDPEHNPYGASRGRHMLPLRDDEVEENSVARDARARLARARVGMAMHAKGGGWRPVELNKEDQAKKPKKKQRPEPELEDRWLRRLARLSPASAMKVASKCGHSVGTGPTLTLLGNLREAEHSDERLKLVERFLQAYGSDAHDTVKMLLRAAAWTSAAS